MAYLASNRNKFTVAGDGAVDVRVELIADIQSGTKVWLQCLPCGDELQENAERHLFECPECGYEMTFPEAGLLAKRHVEAICRKFDVQGDPPRRGFLWRFLGLFVSKKRLSAPKS